MNSLSTRPKTDGPTERIAATGAERRETAELFPDRRVPQAVEKRHPAEEESSYYHQEIRQLRPENNEIVSDTDRQEDQRCADQNVAPALCLRFHILLCHTLP